MSAGTTHVPRSGREPSLCITDRGGRGIPLLLVHGFSHDRSVWCDVAKHLDERLRPIAVDLRGHGDSGWSIDGRYELSDHASDLVRVLDALRIERAVIVGHSLGGNAAILAAAEWPERVDGLVLVDTGPSLSLDALVFVARDAAESLRSYESIAAYRRLLASAYPCAPETVLDGMASAGIVERIDGLFEPKLDPAILRHSHVDLPALQRRLWQALGSIFCPMLLVRGEVSALLAADDASRMVEQTARDATLVTIPGSGHAVMLDDGPALTRAIEAFVEDAARPGCNRWERSRSLLAHTLVHANLLWG